jgi:hypothetical protein
MHDLSDPAMSRAEKNSATIPACIDFSNMERIDE